MSHSPRSRRGVTLIEGLISTVILLVGMVGVLQGLAIASVQNSMANRHTRASTMAQQLLAAIDQQGRARLLAGLFGTPCTTAIPGPLLPFQGDLSPMPASLTAQGFNTANTCFIDFDSAAAYLSLTPGTTAQELATYSRLVAVYRHPSNPEITYIGVNVGWRDGGQVRIVKRFGAVYDTTTNQTNLDF